jgi:hypothetical protein
MSKHGAPLILIAAVFIISCLTPAYAQISYLEQEVQVHNLPLLTAKSAHSSDVLRASLQVIFHDEEVCCGKDSALDDALQYANPRSLKDVASKLDGRHLLSDGRPITVTTEYLTPGEASAGHLVAMILNQHAALIIWNSRVYVLYGVTYVENISENGIMDVTHKLELQDVRFSDSRRQVTFDRVTEDTGNVQGLLFVQWKPD